MDGAADDYGGEVPGLSFEDSYRRDRDRSKSWSSGSLGSATFNVTFAPGSISPELFKLMTGIDPSRFPGYAPRRQVIEDFQLGEQAMPPVVDLSEDEELGFDEGPMFVEAKFLGGSRHEETHSVAAGVSYDDPRNLVPTQSEQVVASYVPEQVEIAHWDPKIVPSASMRVTTEHYVYMRFLAANDATVWEGYVLAGYDWREYFS